MVSARDVPLLPVFVTVVRHGSFTAAARALGLTKSVVSHHVRTLETRCGARLLERTTRRLRVTQMGEQVLEAAATVLDSVQRLDAIVDRERASLSGTLRLTAPTDLGSTLVAPIAARLAREHPSLRIDIVLDDAPRDLVADGFDLGIRLGTLRESSHVVRRLGSTLEVLVATPGLFDDPAQIRRPRDLGDARWVVHAGLERRAWTLRTAGGDRDRVVAHVQTTANHSALMRSLVLTAGCCAVLPGYMVQEDVAAGRLQHLCPSWFGRTIWLQAHLPSRQAPPRARAFLDLLVDAAAAMGFARGLGAA